MQEVKLHLHWKQCIAFKLARNLRQVYLGSHPLHVGRCYFSRSHLKSPTSCSSWLACCFKLLPMWTLLKSLVSDWVTNLWCLVPAWRRTLGWGQPLSGHRCHSTLLATVHEDLTLVLHFHNSSNVLCREATPLCLQTSVCNRLCHNTLLTFTIVV